MLLESEADSLSVECLHSAEAFDQLRAVWQALERQDPQCMPFNTWTWNSLWWQHYATPRDRLALLLVRQERRVVAIAPFYLQASRMGGVLPLRVLRFVGGGGDTSSDYLNIIALPGLRAAAEQAVMHYLPQIKGWQKLLLNDMADTSSLASQARRFVSAQRGTSLAPRYQVIQSASLPDILEACRAQPGREQIADHQNPLEVAGRPELSICATVEELVEASDALRELHRQCRESERQPDALHGLVHEQFHQAIIRQFFAADALWLVTLKLDGKIIGVQYIFVWRGELLFVQSACAAQPDCPSPRELLFAYAIERGIEQGLTGLVLLQGHNACCEDIQTLNESRTVDIGYLRPGVRGLLGAVHQRLTRRDDTTPFVA